MKHARYIWPTFAVSLAVVLAAMAWISLEVLRLGRVEARLDRREEAAEKVRLALWRMDSAVMPLLTRESTRLWSDYAAYRRVMPYDLDRNAARKGDRLFLASPLLGHRSRLILLHFQLDANGKLTSPQVPVGTERELAEKGDVAPEQIQAAAGQLGELEAILKYQPLLAALGEPLPGAESPQLATRHMRRVPGEVVAPSRAGHQHQLSTNEQHARRIAAQLANVAGPSYPGQATTQPRATEAPMEPLWIGEALLLARRVRLGRKEYIQGCRLNWEYTRTWLLEGIDDLLDRADLKPVAADAARDGPNMLATLPVRLIPGDVPPGVAGDTPTGPWAWPAHLPLLIAWVCVLVGAGAVAVMLHGVVKLSQRRGAFVSAVTHELRTPLTTFRLYTDMLAGGMVTDEDQRAKYIRRLNEESQRLTHLVENVLAYARLSERSGGQAETVTLGDLVDRSRDRLAARAEQAEMTLSIEAESESAERLVTANVSAVEQILLNLVDNACKYAARAGDRTIHLELGASGRFATLRVRDHGPGITRAAARRLFRPFSKSAEEAARSAAGVGLGLSLSRRLARDFGGDLHLADQTGGACFELTLPAACD